MTRYPVYAVEVSDQRVGRNRFAAKCGEVRGETGPGCRKGSIRATLADSKVVGLRPMFHHQTWHTPEFADITGDDDQVTTARMRGDQGIEWAYGRLAEHSPDAAEVGGSSPVKIQDTL
jgi:hypothetical protein